MRIRDINLKLYIIALISSFLCILNINAQDPIVNLPQGKIVGRNSNNLTLKPGVKHSLISHRTNWKNPNSSVFFSTPTEQTKVYTEKSLIPIEIYYGIPYATPPIGRFRFAAPERHTGWRRTFYAHRLPPHCPHVGDIASEKTNYSEDCLFLNVWTPRPAIGKPLPVLVILYTESWTRGGVPLPCQDLAAEDLVVVTVGYRLHLLGFFTLASLSARGNLALLDQYMAFLWIRDNISAFGGNINAITVLGHSAGADSVLHHLTSPRSKGLFQRAIIMSPIDIWKLIDEQGDQYALKAENSSREVALSLGCKGNLDLEILNCMRTRSLSDILLAYSNTNWSKSMQPIPEIYLPESEQYLPTSLLTALSSTNQPVMQVDLLLGTTDLDALNYNDNTFYDLLKHNTSYVSDYVNSKSIPKLLRLFSLYRPDVLPMLVRAIRWEYWDNSYVNKERIHEAVEQLARMETSARWSASSALLAARLARHVARLYVYRFSLPSTVDLEGRRLNYTGAVHGLDLISLLGDSIMLQIARRPSISEERQYSSIFRRYISNFIRNGYPESEVVWKRYKPGDAQIFEISAQDTFVYKERRANNDIKFWLQYLPELSSFFRTLGQTEQLTTTEGEERLRGGVFAMCGLAIFLLLLLCSSAILLHRQHQRRRRFSISEDVQS